MWIDIGKKEEYPLNTRLLFRTLQTGNEKEQCAKNLQNVEQINGLHFTYESSYQDVQAQCGNVSLK